MSKKSADKAKSEKNKSKKNEVSAENAKVSEEAAAQTSKEESAVRLPRVRKSGRNLQDSSASTKLIASVLGIMFVVFILLMHYSLSSRSVNVGDEANQSSDGLYYTMKISKRSQSRDPIMLLLSITNTSGIPKTLDFDKDTQVDFVVQNRVNVFFDQLPVEVWRYSKDHKSYNSQRSLTILPNEERVFAVKWNQTDNNGERVQGGRYIITGEINTSGGSKNLKSGG